jgi:hypothetical protein
MPKPTTRSNAHFHLAGNKPCRGHTGKLVNTYIGNIGKVGDLGRHSNHKAQGHQNTITVATTPSLARLFPKLTASQFDRVLVLLAVLVGMTSGASNEDTDKAFGVFCRAYVSLIATGLKTISMPL